MHHFDHAPLDASWPFTSDHAMCAWFPEWPMRACHPGPRFKDSRAGYRPGFNRVCANNKLGPGLRRGDEFIAVVTRRSVNWATACAGATTSLQSRRADQSTFAPDALTTFAHLSVSARMCATNFSGEPPATSAPCASSCSLPSGLCKYLFTSAFSLAMIGAGVPAGARMPNHELASKPGRPDSAIVGTSGSAGARLSEVTATARTLPDLISASDEGRLSNMICT